MNSSMKEVVIPAGGEKPLGSYSPGIGFGDLILTPGRLTWAQTLADWYR